MHGLTFTYVSVSASKVSWFTVNYTNDEGLLSTSYLWQYIPSSKARLLAVELAVLLLLLP